MNIKDIINKNNIAYDDIDDIILDAKEYYRREIEDLQREIRDLEKYKIDNMPDNTRTFTGILKCFNKEIFVKKQNKKLLEEQYKQLF